MTDCPLIPIQADKGNEDNKQTLKRDEQCRGGSQEPLLNHCFVGHVTPTQVDGIFLSPSDPGGMQWSRATLKIDTDSANIETDVPPAQSCQHRPDGFGTSASLSHNNAMRLTSSTEAKQSQPQIGNTKGILCAQWIVHKLVKDPSIGNQ
jgi:hypothetical protein